MTEYEKETYLETSAIKRLKKIYGDVINKRIIKRLNEELQAFSSINQLDNILLLKEDIERKRRRGTLIIPRLSIPNSFLLFLLGINNINPLPRHTYCPKCHSFYWGNKKEDKCECCEETLIEDGYDLDYQLLIDDLKRGASYTFSTSSQSEINEHYKFISLKELKLAKELGLKQKDINRLPNNIDEIIRCLDESYYKEHYKKKNIVDHQAFIGIGDLGSSLLYELLEEYKVHDFDELIKVVEMLHGTGVYDANEEFIINPYNPNINECITSRDDLFKLLKDNQFDDSDALLMCKETRLCGKGHLSELSEYKLKEAKVEEQYIKFMKAISYLFHKGHVVSYLTLLSNIAKIYLEEPKRYYGAFLSINKELVPNYKYEHELISGLINSKNSALETIYLALIELEELKTIYLL